MNFTFALAKKATYAFIAVSLMVPALSWSEQSQSARHVHQVKNYEDMQTVDDLELYYVVGDMRMPSIEKECQKFDDKQTDLRVKIQSCYSNPLLGGPDNYSRYELQMKLNSDSDFYKLCTSGKRSFIQKGKCFPSFRDTPRKLKANINQTKAKIKTLDTRLARINTEPLEALKILDKCSNLKKSDSVYSRLLMECSVFVPPSPPNLTLKEYYIDLNHPRKNPKFMDPDARESNLKSKKIKPISEVTESQAGKDSGKSSDALR